MKDDLIYTVRPLDDKWKNLIVVVENNGADIVARVIKKIGRQFSKLESAKIYMGETKENFGPHPREWNSYTRAYYVGTYLPKTAEKFTSEVIE